MPKEEPKKKEDEGAPQAAEKPRMAQGLLSSYSFRSEGLPVEVKVSGSRSSCPATR